MKRYFIICFLSVLLSQVNANGPSDLVIMNPYGSPGDDKVEDFSVEFFDVLGKKLNLEYTIDPITGKITVRGASGTVFISVTNKKTNVRRTSKVVFVNVG